MEGSTSSIELPGFRFHPTEEELLGFYLKNMVDGKKMNLDVISFLNIYRHDPWDLPALARIGEREWYFFVPRDRKHGNGGRPNRTTKRGYWKATGSDRKVVTLSDPKRIIGLRKTLVFYQGRAPRGSKTDWVMNEYRLPDDCALSNKDIVLCKIYRKATSLKELEQRAAMEEVAVTGLGGDKSILPSYPTSPLSSSNGTSSNFCGQLEDLLVPFISKSDMTITATNYNDNNILTFKKKEEKFDENFVESTCRNEAASKSNSIQLPFGKDSLGELQLPKTNTDWAQEPLYAQCFSPWLENLLNLCSPTLFSQFLST